MLGMAPLMLIAVNEAQENNRDPGIDKYGIKQKVQPRLRFDIKLQQNDYRQQILSQGNYREQLGGQESIYICKELPPQTHLNIRQNNEQRGYYHKMGLD